jgi:hypothetical protein
MSTPIDDGGPAFPHQVRVHDYDPATGLRVISPITDEGMSLRDWFVGQALAGWLGSYGADSNHPVLNETTGMVAQHSYAMADAMLAERRKGGVK